MKRFFLMSFLTLLFIACNSANPVLTITGGQVQGAPIEGTGVFVYKGIPFAAPPVGDLRWKAPQDVKPWEGVYQATEFGHPAWQPAHTPGGYTPEFFYDGDPEYSEDCLDLNIWTPAPGKTGAKLPVTMWIHGGGYGAGWSFEPEMDGLQWAKRGVVLVTINYRLGLIGFMTHPDLLDEAPAGRAGNYGMLDQIKALQWIRDNIAQFGGDPDNVTIMGQSAGAASVQTLCVSPLARGMFNKAIIQSGRNIINDNTAGDDMLATAVGGKKLMDWAGCATLEEMRAKNAADFVTLSMNYMRETGERVRVAAAPVVDGYALPEKFSSATFGNRIADVPYMVGCTTGDGANGKSGVLGFAEERAKIGKSVFTYQFARDLPTDGREGVLKGAFHSSELWYMFGSMEYCWRPFTSGDYALSDQMLTYWTNFAKFGNPNGKDGKGAWVPFSKDNKESMIFKLDGSETKVISAMGQMQ